MGARDAEINRLQKELRVRMYFEFLVGIRICYYMSGSAISVMLHEGLHIIIQFSNATNFMLHRMSCCTGCHVAPEVMLHRKSCCTPGVR